jgi:hypothetical protein
VYVRFISLSTARHTLVEAQYYDDVISVTRGRRRQKMTSPFDVACPLLFKWSVDVLSLFFSVLKLFDILVLA